LRRCLYGFRDPLIENVFAIEFLICFNGKVAGRLEAVAAGAGSGSGAVGGAAPAAAASGDGSGLFRPRNISFSENAYFPAPIPTVLTV
jgi:hypothetical protein